LLALLPIQSVTYLIWANCLVMEVQWFYTVVFNLNCYYQFIINKTLWIPSPLNMCDHLKNWVVNSNQKKYIEIILQILRPCSIYSYPDVLSNRTIAWCNVRNCRIKIIQFSCKQYQNWADCIGVQSSMELYYWHMSNFCQCFCI
jgi:hypothetical protein